MKSWMIGIIFLATPAFATSGIDCKSIDGTLEISTEEAAIAGDNVVSLRMVAPWIQPQPIVFKKSKGQVNVAREEGTVYMAQDSRGRSITLALNTEERDGISISTAYVRASGAPITETLICKGADAE